MRHSRRFLRQGGYTLLELVICMPLMALLMLGMSSAILISSRAMPDNESAGSALLQSAAALDGLAAELTNATTINSRSSTALTFVTPDRGSDGVADTISYSWSGTAGTPLLRQVNGSTAEEVITSVQRLALTYDAPVSAALGVPLLRTLNVRVEAPAGNWSAVDASITVLNEPQLP